MSETNLTDDATASTDEKILYSTKSAGRIAYITLNNPTKLNAVDKDMIMRLLDVLNEANQDKKVKVVVINSTGDRAFCAGWDLTMFKSQDMSYSEVVDLLLNHGRDISRTIFFMKKPVIAQMQGSAIGLGCYMALAADFRIVARKEDLFFQLPEMQVNLPGATGPTVNSIAIMGLARSKRMMLTCEKIGLDELDRWGIITKICEPGDMEVEVKKFCLNLVEKNPLLISTQKMMCNIMGMAETRPYYDLENEVAEYVVKNVGNEHPDDFDEFIRNMWSKYGQGTPF
ncbi:MAG TPA: enoyl-CoA hydratase/isomerase family protein [Candidatus Lokiarchaeia archaeon]|nr:enoyl-CoA hydratase/isomerase family protein [Candidatus Lokiarchaeia archaeon]